MSDTDTDSQHLGTKAILDHETEKALLAAQARFEALRRVLSVLAATDKLDAGLQSIADITAQVVEAELVVIYTFDLGQRKVDQVVRGGPGAADFASSDDSTVETSVTWALDAWQPGHQPSGISPRAWPGGAYDPTPWTTITAPIIYCERLLGIFRASNPPQRPPFVLADEALLTTLANQAALVIESHRLRQEERSQHKQADTLREVARIINYSLDQQRVLELILDQLARVVAYDSASVMLLQNDQISIVAHRKFRLAEQLIVPTRLAGYQHIREVMERRRPVIIEDTQQDQRWQNLPGNNYIKCWLGVPLVGRDGVIGLINLDKEIPNFYNQHDAALASTFANQAAIAIENARLYTAERQRVEQLNALRAIVADISAELELTRLLQSILQRAVLMLKASGGDIGLYDENTREVTILSSYNMERDYTGTRMRLGEGAMGLAVQYRRPVIVDDYARWENASPQYIVTQMHAAIAMPFLIGRRIVGVIGMVDADVQRKFGPSDQHLLSLFAQHAAIAVENARLFLSARQATERRNILHQVSQDIVSVNLDPEGIYEAIHRAAARLMPAEAFAITRVVDGQNKFEAVYLLDRGGRAPNTVLPIDHGLTGRIIRTGESVMIRDLSQDSQTRDTTTHFGDPIDVSSILAVPMRLRGSVVGMVSAQSYSLDAYSADDQYLLEMLANYAAIALENVGLFQHVQQLAIADPLLTDIFNRRHMFELGEREVQRAQRFGRSLGVLMIDLDHFKQVNDRFGHAVGDDVLRRLSRLLHEHVREIDICGRYGGEELVVILPEADLPGTVDAGQRLCYDIQQDFAAGSLPPITVSIGAAALNAEIPDFTTLVHLADLAMYQAKQAGGNRVAAAEQGEKPPAT